MQNVWETMEIVNEIRWVENGIIYFSRAFASGEMCSYVRISFRKRQAVEIYIWYCSIHDVWIARVITWTDYKHTRMILTNSESWRTMIDHDD